MVIADITFYVIHNLLSKADYSYRAELISSVRELCLLLPTPPKNSVNYPYLSEAKPQTSTRASRPSLSMLVNHRML